MLIMKQTVWHIWPRHILLYWHTSDTMSVFYRVCARQIKWMAAQYHIICVCYVSNPTFHFTMHVDKYNNGIMWWNDKITEHCETNHYQTIACHGYRRKCLSKAINNPNETITFFKHICNLLVFCNLITPFGYIVPDF